MVFHIGMDIVFGDMEVYNEESKETISFKTTTKLGEESKKEDIEKMFKEIKIKIDGRLGYACIFLHWTYGNEIRKSLIEKGKDFGLLNVQIINYDMCIYLNNITQINQKPKNVEIVWIYYAFEFYIWKKLNSNAKIVKMFKYKTEENLIAIMQKEKNDYGNEINPDILIYPKYLARDLKSIKSLFPKCQCFEIISNPNLSEVALIKARIMAKHEEVLDYDVDSQLDVDIDVKINENIIMSIKMHESLPFEKRMKINYRETVFKIFVGERFEEEFPVSPPIRRSPPYEIVVKVDCNRIIAINYVNLLTEEKTRQEALENEEKNYYEEITKSRVLFGQNSNQLMHSYMIPTKIMASKKTSLNEDRDAAISIQESMKRRAEMFVNYVDFRKIYGAAQHYFPDLISIIPELALHAGCLREPTKHFIEKNKGNVITTSFEFENLASKLLEKIQNVIIETLSTTNYTALDIHKILLVGGSSRMPMIQHLLRKMFTNAEHLCTENPDEVVAIGAAYYAYYLATQ